MKWGYKKFLTMLFLAAVLGGIFLPLGNVHAQGYTSANTGQTSTETPVPPDALKEAIGCGPLLDPLDRCIAYGLYWILDQVGGTVLTAAGYFFNAMLGVGISSKIINDSGFITEGWSIARDIANLFFIFVLIFIALRTILGLGKGTTGMIAKLIVVAILINFSMFFARVVIDASNGLALLFYNRITVTDKSGQPIQHYPIIDSLVTGVEEKDIGSAIVSAFHPQILTSPDFYNSLKEDKSLPSFSLGGAYQFYQGGGIVGLFKKEVPVTVLLTVIILSGLVYWYAAWCLFIAGLSFLGRIVGLFISLILVPIALVTYITPLPGDLKSLSSLSWRSWVSQFLTLCFGAPVFMFFLYIIVLFTKADLFSSLNKSPDWIVQLVLIAIPLLLIMYLLKKATDYAKKMGGEVGEMIVGWGDRAIKTVGGFAVGAASAGAGFALQSSIGANAQKKLNDKDLQDRAAKGDKGAQRELRRAEYLSTRTFDLRDTGIGKFGAKQLGIDPGKTKGLETFLGTPGIFGGRPIDISTKGGAAGRTDRFKKAQLEDSKLYTVEGAAAREQNEKAREWQKKYETERDLAREAALKNSINFSESNFRDMYTKGEAIIKNAAGGEVFKVAGSAYIPDAKDLNKERKLTQADALQYGQGYVEAKAVAREDVENARAYELRTKGSSNIKFDEKEWRNNGIKDSSGTILADGYFNPGNPAPSMDQATREIVAELRNKSGEETKDRELTGKARKKVEAQLEKSKNSLDKIVSLLDDVKTHNSLVSVTDVKSDHIDKTIDAKEDTIETLAAANMKEEESIKAGSPPSPSYLANKRKIKKHQDDIKKLKTLFDDKFKLEEERQEYIEKLGL